MVNCDACKQPINGTYIQAFGMNWHTEHLRCKICKKTFANEPPIEGEDGFAYCLEDWRQTFCPQCAHCKKPIEGQSINAIGKTFHPEHFVCSQCENPLEKQFYISSDGDPLCELHYHKSNNTLCANCNKGIVVGKVISIRISEDEEIKYHPHHFCCSHCTKKMNDLMYNIHQKKPYCVDCSMKLFQ